MKIDLEPRKTNLEPWKTIISSLEPWKTNLEPWKRTQLEKVIIFRDRHLSSLREGSNWPLRCLFFAFKHIFVQIWTFQKKVEFNLLSLALVRSLKRFWWNLLCTRCEKADLQFDEENLINQFDKESCGSEILCIERLAQFPPYVKFILISFV